jgi:hypothetical protein
MKHGFKGNRQSCFMAQHDLGEGVADEHHIESGAVRQFGCGTIICGNKGDSLPALFASNKIWRDLVFANVAIH